MMFNVIIILGFVLAVESGPVNDRKEAFDPEQLMTRYMNMRTNQGLFGSYHPNDLVNSIVEYFNRDGTQSLNNNQWGLAVYNPNQKLGQYMGIMNSPGNLGPQSENVKQAGGSAFNPNTLNQRLMQNALSSGNRFSNSASPSLQGAAKGQDNVGFNVDSLNKQMIESTIDKAETTIASIQENSTRATSTEANDKAGQNVVDKHAGQMIGFNPDTLNAGLINSFSSSGIANSASSGGHLPQGDTRAMMLGFNPDTLNAGLINSIGYDPNSAAGKMPTYNRNGATFGELVHGAESKDSPASEENVSQENASGTSGLNSMTVVNGGTAVNKNGGQTGSHTDDDAAGSGHLAENGQVSMTSNTSMYNSNQSGTKPASVGTTGIFSAGDIGPQGYGNQNSGMPPGVPDGTAVHQTDPATAKVHGIGGMG